MANPQLEDGYLKLSNEIVDALIRIRIPGEARQALDFIIRKTYGFNKKRDAISLSQFVEATGISRPNVIRGIIKLETMCIIKKETGSTTNYMFNKNFEEWKPLSKKRRGVSKKIISVIKKDNQAVSKKRHTKDTLTKDNIQKTYNAIVSDLNEKAKTQYRPTSRKTQDLIKARLNEGFNIDNFKTVHTVKCDEWLKTDMEKYLRPETLYSNKFEGYLNQRPKKQIEAEEKYSKTAKCPECGNVGPLIQLPQEYEEAKKYIGKEPIGVDGDFRYCYACKHRWERD